MSRLTMLMIATNPESVHIFVNKDASGKYGGMIAFGEFDYNRPLITTANTFSTEDAAREYMKKVVEFCGKWADKDIQSAECGKEFEELQKSAN